MARVRPRAVLLLWLFVLAGCEIVIQPLVPTSAPPSSPESACAMVFPGRLEEWIEEKLPRLEQDLAGGTLYLSSPLVTNCVEGTAFFQVRVGYERPGLLVELAIVEASFDLRYDPQRGDVCLDLHILTSSPKMRPEGVEQVGREIKVAEVSSEVSRSLQPMPAGERQQLDKALKEAWTQGSDPQVQGIGTEAAGILLDWAVPDLLDRFNRELARLLGACITLS